MNALMNEIANEAAATFTRVNGTAAPVAGVVFGRKAARVAYLFALCQGETETSAENAASVAAYAEIAKVASDRAA